MSILKRLKVFESALKMNCLFYLLEDLVQLLQGWPDGAVSAHAPGVPVEVNVRHPVQSVMSKGADHRWTDGPVLTVSEPITGKRRLLIEWRVIFTFLKCWVLHVGRSAEGSLTPTENGGKSWRQVSLTQVRLKCLYTCLPSHRCF